VCFYKLHPEREPVSLLGDDEGVCCVCGDKAYGIYIRAEPNSLKCQNKGPEHQDSAP
jgi:hypothetical protein